MRGAREALEPLFDEPGLDFRMARVFIDMLPADDLEAARDEAARVADSRMTAFHDPERRLGRAMARRLGWEQQTAWDIFLVYGSAESWTATALPAPHTWFHQLNDGETRDQPAEDERETSESTEAPAERSEADPALFRTGEDLRTSLIEAIRAAARTTASGRE